MCNPRTASPRPHPQPCISTHRLGLSTLCWWVDSYQRVLVLVVVYTGAGVYSWSLWWPPRGVAAALKSPFGWPPFAPLCLVRARVAKWLVVGAWCKGAAPLPRQASEATPPLFCAFRWWPPLYLLANRRLSAAARSGRQMLRSCSRYGSASFAVTAGCCAAPLQLYLPVVYTTANVCIHLAIRLCWCLQKYALRVYRCKPS